MSKISPFVKWAGGKRQIMEKLLEFMPKTYKRYYEPFIGGGAFLFELEPNKAIINDSNKELICIYKCLRNEKQFKKFYEYCKTHEVNHSEEYYYKIRNLDKKKSAYSRMSVPEKAARCIYLNKACFNGLYRVNSKGEFNVPFNGKDKIYCFNDENIYALHKYFHAKKPIILNKDFAKAVKTVKAGDFVYFDPPYDVLGDKSFISYTTEGFNKKEQIRLRDLIKDLTEKGVLVMASNANTDFIKEIYKDFNIHIIKANRRINSKAEGRGNVEEVIITNY